MAKTDAGSIESKLRAEIEQSDAHPDTDAGAEWRQPNLARSVVYSVRLNANEVARIERMAGQLRVPSSAVVRGWILDALAASETDTVTGALDRVEADLRRLRATVTRG